MIYGVAVISKLSKNDSDQGATEELVIAPTWVCANDEKTAVAKVLKSHQGSIDLDHVEVVVVPFGKRL